MTRAFTKDHEKIPSCVSWKNDYMGWLVQSCYTTQVGEVLIFATSKLEWFPNFRVNWYEGPSKKHRWETHRIKLDCWIRWSHERLQFMVKSRQGSPRQRMSHLQLFLLIRKNPAYSSFIEPDRDCRGKFGDHPWIKMYYSLVKSLMTTMTTNCFCIP